MQNPDPSAETHHGDIGGIAPILHVAVAGWLLGPEPSGATRRQLALLRAAANHLLPGERITLLCRTGSSPVNPPPGVTVLEVPIPPRPSWRRAFAERRILPSLLRELEATVFDLGTLPVPARLPCPVALTVHDLRDLSEFRRRPVGLGRTVLRRGVARCDHLVAPSAFTARALRDEISEPRPPITIVPGGVDESFFRRIVSPPSQPYFVHVGHLERRKNLQMLLRAYAKFRAQTGPQRTPTLVLAGNDRGLGGTLRKQAAALGLSSSIELLGDVAEEDLRDLYGRAAAVLFPSLYEGFGLPALEALAMGRPLVVSDRGALPEVVGDAALVVNGEDEEAWARAMVSAWRAPERESDDHLRRRRAREFRWDDAAARLLQTWRRTQLAKLATGS